MSGIEPASAVITLLYRLSNDTCLDGRIHFTSAVLECEDPHALIRAFQAESTAVLQDMLNWYEHLDTGVPWNPARISFSVFAKRDQDGVMLAGMGGAQGWYLDYVLGGPI